MECQFCKQILSSKSALNTHQTKTKYCLKIQGKIDVKGTFVCKLCNKNFLNNNRYKYHINICKSDTFYIKKLEQSELLVQRLEKDIDILKHENIILREDKKDLQERYDKLSLTAVKRPTTNNKNIQINNFIQNIGTPTS